MWQAGWLAAAVAFGVAVSAAAADGVQIKLGERGLESLTYDGVEYVDPSGAGGAAFETKPTATKVDGNAVEQTYPWGTLTAVYEAKAELEKAKLGPVPKEQIYENGGKETLPRAKYAHDRWGCTLFYLDSISGVFGYWSMDEAARGLPDCLFLPEWAVARSYRCSAQLSVTGITGYRRGVPPEIQAAWPDAFCGMFHLDYAGIASGKNEAAREDLETAVRRGNLPVFDCFYDNADAVKAISAVYATTGVKHAPLAVDQTASTTSDNPVAIALGATDEDGDPLAFTILGPPAHGTLTAFDEKTGRVTYTPAKGWKGGDRFTFKAVDATGPSSNRGTVTITAK
jgi:hypothetical protein